MNTKIVTIKQKIEKLMGTYQCPLSFGPCCQIGGLQMSSRPEMSKAFYNNYVGIKVGKWAYKQIETG